MDNEITIISNNCWGAEVYKDYRLPYNTPFVGLFIPPACFVKFCNNINYYLSKDLNFILDSKYTVYNELRFNNKYPLAILDDIEIHFLHYKSNHEASEKWNRRLSRMSINPQNWRIKGCDREIEDIEEFKKSWNKIPFTKVFFSSKQIIDLDDSVFLSEFINKTEVCDGKALYEVSKKYFDLDFWINHGLIRRNYMHKIYSSFKMIFHGRG